MPIIGMSFASIEASKDDVIPQKEVKVNTMPEIVNVKEIDVQAFNEKALSVEFDFTTKYDPAFAHIKIKGSVIYRAEKSKAIVDEWKKSKKLPENMSLEILNYLFRRCLLKATMLADDLQIPPPMPIPTISPNREKK